MGALENWTGYARASGKPLRPSGFSPLQLTQCRPVCYFLSILQLTLFAAGVALITIMSHGLSLATKLWLAKQETQRLAKQQQEAAEQRRQVSEAWQVGRPRGHSSLGAAFER